MNMYRLVFSASQHSTDCLLNQPFTAKVRSFNMIVVYVLQPSANICSGGDGSTLRVSTTCICCDVIQGLLCHDKHY